MSTFDEYRKIFKLKENFTEEDLTNAYRKLALKYHPDVNKSYDATEKFKKINAAYSYLKDYISNGNYSSSSSTYSSNYNYQENNKKDNDTFYEENSSNYSYSNSTNYNYEDFANGYYSYQQSQNANSQGGYGCVITLLLIIIFALLGHLLFSDEPDITFERNFDKQETQTPQTSSNSKTSSDYNSVLSNTNNRTENTNEYDYFENDSDSVNKNAASNVNFAPYMQELERRIKMNWDPPKGNTSNQVVVMFRVAKDGSIMSVNVKDSSGSYPADTAAINAVKLTAPFRPLPAEFKGNYVDIQFTFAYNVLGSPQPKQQYNYIKQYEPNIQPTFPKPTKKNTQNITVPKPPKNKIVQTPKVPTPQKTQPQTQDNSSLNINQKEYEKQMKKLEKAVKKQEKKFQKEQKKAKKELEKELKRLEKQRKKENNIN